MASEERYLWTVTYQLGKRDHIWLGYFVSREALDEFLASVLRFFPEIELKEIEECKDGLVLFGQYFHNKLSVQKRINKLVKKPEIERALPDAPFALDQYV
jgi:hypothetical protein